MDKPTVKDLITALRYCGQDCSCTFVFDRDDCPYYREPDCYNRIKNDAADVLAIFSRWLSASGVEIDKLEDD